MSKIFTLIIVFTYVTCIAAQSPEKQKTRFTVYINEEKGGSIKAEVLNKNTGPVAKENLTYYWYSPNQIIETKGGYSGKLLHGNYTSFYSNKNLKEKGSFYQGLKSGRWMKWYDNGKIMEVVTWRESMKHGKYKLYNELGDIVLDANFKDDKLNGKAVSYHLGKILSIKHYKNGEEIIPKPESGKVEKNKIDKGVNKGDTPTLLKNIGENFKKLFKKKEKSTDKKNKKPAPTQSTGCITHISFSLS